MDGLVYTSLDELLAAVESIVVCDVELGDPAEFAFGSRLVPVTPIRLRVTDVYWGTDLAQGSDLQWMLPGSWTNAPGTSDGDRRILESPTLALAARLGNEWIRAGLYAVGESGDLTPVTPMDSAPFLAHWKLAALKQRLSTRSASVDT
jgi:hypothetical protein